MAELSDRLAAERDRRMTADRKESKFLVPPRSVAPLMRHFASQMARHEHRTAFEQFGGGCGEALDEEAWVQISARRGLVRHYITTLYFDTEDRDIYRQNIESVSATKLRAREYYDIHPALTELVTAPREAVRDTSKLWLEVKHKARERTQKTRFCIPKIDTPKLFEHGEISHETVAIQQRLYGEQAHQALDQLTALIASFEQPLRADCIVNYRRRAWQSEDGQLRITLDSQISCMRPHDELWQNSAAWTRAVLGHAVYEQAESVLEVKTHGPVPQSLHSVMQQLAIEPAMLRTTSSAKRRYSKFLTASEAVHGQ